MNILEYSSASRFIRKNYKVGSIGLLKLGEMKDVKKGLIYSLSLSDIRNLKASINAQLELYKQVSVIVSVAVFIMTALLTFLKSSTKAYGDYLISSNGGKDPDMQYYIANQVNSMDYISILILYTIILILVMLYFSRFKTIASLKYIIDEAYEEKKNIEEKKGKRREKSISGV